MAALPLTPAAGRTPILAVFKRVLPDRGLVLEIAIGTGCTWLTSPIAVATVGVVPVFRRYCA